MGRRLGLELNEEKPCPLCFEILGTDGAHAEGCMGGGDAVARHNENRDTLHKQAKARGTRPELEKTKLLAGLNRNVNLGGRRPADTLLHSTGGIHTARGRQMGKIALDVGIVNPQAASHIHNAARETLGAAKGYTQHKRERNDTDRLCMQAGVDYQPMVWESLGGCSAEASEVVKSLNRLVANNTNTPLAEVAHRFWQRTSVDLQKANHRAWAKRALCEDCCPSARSHSARFLQT
jgi:hypothetical protein